MSKHSVVSLLGNDIMQIAKSCMVAVLSTAIFKKENSTSWFLSKHILKIPPAAGLPAVKSCWGQDIFCPQQAQDKPNMNPLSVYSDRQPFSRVFDREKFFPTSTSWVMAHINKAQLLIVQFITLLTIKDFSGIYFHAMIIIQ